MTRIIHTMCAAGIAMLLAGCVTVSESNPTPPLVKPARGAGAPAKMTVSPLTRVGFDSSNDAAVFLHLDFRDSDDRAVKAFGALRVELVTSGAADAASARSWDADLADPVRNALSYDEMITRTYTINLSGVPEGVVRWVRHETDGPAPSVVVRFVPAGASESGAMRATYALTR